MADPAGQGEPGSRPASASFPWTIVPQPGAGEKHAGAFAWSDTVLRGLRWPYFAVRGRYPGRSVAILAGLHGDAYLSILGTQRLGRLLDPERVHGSLLILPLVNLSAFRERTAWTPQDGHDLNRAFPGKATGTFSQVLALRLTQEVVSPADAVIGLHGDSVEATLNHTCHYQTGDPAVDDLAREMSEGFGLFYAMTYPQSDEAHSPIAQAASLGKPGLMATITPQRLATEDDVLIVYQGLVNALRTLGVLIGRRTPSEVRRIEPAGQVTAPADGLWRPLVGIEQHVAAGETVGILTDLLGDEIIRLTTVSDGIVLSQLSALAARTGDPLVRLAREQGTGNRG